MIDALIALSERLEMREVRHDVHPPPLSLITVFIEGWMEIAKYREGRYYWHGVEYDDVERCALAIALDVFNAEPARSPRRSGRTPRAHHRRTYTDPNGRNRDGT